MLVQHLRKIWGTRIARSADREGVEGGREPGACVGVGGGPPGRYIDRKTSPAPPVEKDTREA